MLRPCDHCGERYEAKRPSSKFCSARCRNRHARNPDTSKITRIVQVTTGGSLGGLVEATRQELADVQLLDTMLGQQALALAERVASASETGSAVAALSKELRSVVTQAMQGAKRDQSPLDSARDELAARRAQHGA